MTKKELAVSVKNKWPIMTIQSAEHAINIVGAAINEALANGHEVKLPGLGTFSVKARPARTAHNPATGAPVQVPAKNVVKFKASATLLV